MNALFGEGQPIVANYGGGVNSTALLIGLHNMGVRPDLVIFADTGGEMPETYGFLGVFDEWLQSVGFPRLTIVKRNTQLHTSLEEECHNNQTLPGLAFGFRGCSDKWKRRPVDQFVRRWDSALAAWADGKRVVRLLGIDAGETHRGKNLPSETRFEWRFPLIEWDWARQECIEAIENAGLPVPGKSACFFCPAMKKHEVLELSKSHPDLFARCVAMERHAAPKLEKVKGLGRNWSWEELVATDEATRRSFPDSQDEPCVCFDGSDD